MTGLEALRYLFARALELHRDADYCTDPEQAAALRMHATQLNNARESLRDVCLCAVALAIAIEREGNGRDQLSTRAEQLAGLLKAVGVTPELVKAEVAKAESLWAAGLVP